VARDRRERPLLPPAAPSPRPKALDQHIRLVAGLETELPESQACDAIGGVVFLVLA
jgi:hypothetical protein